MTTMTTDLNKSIDLFKFYYNVLNYNIYIYIKHLEVYSFKRFV